MPHRTAPAASPAASIELSAPLSPAERASAHRQRQKARGLSAVKCYLPPDAMAYLGALCDIHRITISAAVAMAVTAAVRGERLPPR